jgi:hypothetical protein
VSIHKLRINKNRLTRGRCESVRGGGPGFMAIHAEICPNLYGHFETSGN